MTYDKIKDTIAGKFHSLVVFAGQALVPLLFCIGTVGECLINVKKQTDIGYIELYQGIVKKSQQLLSATVIHYGSADASGNKNI